MIDPKLHPKWNDAPTVCFRRDGTGELHAVKRPWWRKLRHWLYSHGLYKYRTWRLVA